jgi:hypothetical protein
MSGHSLEFPLVMDLQRRVCVPNKTPDGTEGEVLWRQLSAARMVVAKKSEWTKGPMNLSGYF